MNFHDVIRSMAAAVATHKSAADTLKELREEIAAAQHKRHALIMAPPARQDLEAMVRSWVATRAAEFERDFAERLKRFAGDARALENQRLIDTFVTLAGGADSPPGALDRALCAAIPQQITAAMLAGLKTIEWPEKSVRLADRQAQIEVLQQREAQLQQQEGELVAAIEAAAQAARE